MESAYERVRNKKQMWDVIHLAQNDAVKVFVWGTGLIGTGMGYEFLRKLTVKVDFFCDSNSEKWGSDIKDGIKCVDPEMMKNYDDVVCFVLVGIKAEYEVCQRLQDMGITKYVTCMELSTTNLFLYDVFPFLKQPRIAVYTCITGGYDELIVPEYISEECDYYLISEKDITGNTIYDWISLYDVVPYKELDFTRQNRYCKINVHEIFPQYDYSIYVDGNIKIISDIAMCLADIKRSGMAVSGKSSSLCTYVEALRCIGTQKDDKVKITRQIERYYREGMPRYFGEFLCNVLVRDHTNPVCRRLMRDWWNEVYKESKRDQISFPYVLWKNGLIADDVGTITENPRQGSCYWKYDTGHKGR